MCFSFFIFSYLTFPFKIEINSSWLISMSVDAWDAEVSMLFSLLLTRTRILSSFFFYFLLYSVFFSIPVVKEKTKVKRALATLTGAPITVVKEIIDTPQLVA